MQLTEFKRGFSLWWLLWRLLWRLGTKQRMFASRNNSAMNRSPSSNWELGVLYTQLLHLAKFYTWIQHAHISNGGKCFCNGDRCCILNSHFGNHEKFCAKMWGYSWRFCSIAGGDFDMLVHPAPTELKVRGNELKTILPTWDLQSSLIAGKSLKI